MTSRNDKIANACPSLSYSISSSPENVGMNMHSGHKCNGTLDEFVKAQHEICPITWGMLCFWSNTFSQSAHTVTDYCTDGLQCQLKNFNQASTYKQTFIIYIIQ